MGVQYEITIPDRAEKPEGQSSDDGMSASTSITSMRPQCLDDGTNPEAILSFSLTSCISMAA